MRLRQRDMRPVTFRPRISAKETDGTTYETWGEAETVRVNVQPAGGRVMAEQYGERLSYMLTMYISDRVDLAESSGAWVFVTGEDPDYKVVAVRPWGSHTVIELEKVRS